MARVPTRLALAFAVALAGAMAGCAGPSDEGDEAADERGEGSDALGAKLCAASDTSLFFHGMHGYGRELAKPGLCAPKLNNSGPGSFWSDVAFTAAPAATVAGGYSAGRIPLIRRLEKGEGPEQTAVMLDPSYSDGPRFEGRTGPAIVDAWLDGDAARRFVLVYSPASTGWREFAALASGAHRGQVKVCAVTAPHLELPGIVTAQLFVDPETWVRERCAR